jgi:hypothetical protein
MYQHRIEVRLQFRNEDVAHRQFERGEHAKQCIRMLIHTNREGMNNDAAEGVIRLSSPLQLSELSFSPMPVEY